MKKEFVILVALASFIGTIYGQSAKIERYKGKMKKPDEISMLLGESWESGGGFYDYYVNENSERVKHGELLFRTDKELLSDKIYEVKGNFLHGKKNGKWTIRRFNNQKGKYEDSEYYVSLTFSNDSLNGTYKIVRLSSGEGELAFLAALMGVSYEKTYETCTGLIRNGILSPDNWQYNNIVHLDVNGYPHGLYKTTCTDGGIPIMHERYYNHGCLIYIYEFDESTGKGEYVYRISDMIDRSVNPQGFKDTMIYGKRLTEYKGGYYTFVKAKYDTMNSRCQVSSPVILIPELIRDLMPSVQKGWDVTLKSFDIKELERQERNRILDSVIKEGRRVSDSIAKEKRRVSDSIAMVIAIRNRLADSTWEKNSSYYELFFENKASFRKIYELGDSVVQDKIETENRREWELTVSDIPYLWKVDDVVLIDDTNHIKYLFSSYDEFVRYKMLGEKNIKRKVAQTIQLNKELMRQDALAERNRLLQEVERKAHRKQIIRTCVFSGLVVVGLAVWGIVTDFTFSNITF